MGGATAACVAGGLSNRNPKLALLGLVLGGICGRYGASTLYKIQRQTIARPPASTPAAPDKNPPASIPAPDRNSHAPTPGPNTNPPASTPASDKNPSDSTPAPDRSLPGP